MRSGQRARVTRRGCSWSSPAPIRFRRPNDRGSARASLTRRRARVQRHQGDSRRAQGNARARRNASAQISVTLTGRLDARSWTALARPAKRLKAGDRIVFGEGEGVCLLGTLAATVEERGAEGEVTLAFDFSDASLDEAIARLGAMPLPPYIASRRRAGREGPRRLSDHIRARGGRGGGADRRAAFHTPADRGAKGARRVGAFRDAACRPRHLSPRAQRRHRRPHHA